MKLKRMKDDNDYCVSCGARSNYVLKKHGGIDLAETLRRSEGLPEEVA